MTKCKRCDIGESSDDDGYCLSCRLFSAKDRILTLERQCIVETCSLESKLSAARAQVATLAEALAFYAAKDNWEYPYSDDMEPGDICERGVLVDFGDRARAALKAAGVEP